MWYTSDVISRAPVAPSGCPSAIAPPFGFTFAGSAPVSACQAPSTLANASFTSKAPMSRTLRPDFASAAAVAGIGPVSIVTGSTPSTTEVWNRASGRRPSDGAISLVVISSAAAPSEICEEFAAVCTPSGRNAGRTLATLSRVPPRRGPSSVLNSRVVPSSAVTSMGEICAVNRPSSIAAAARRCDSSPMSSARPRSIPHLSAICSAPRPWLNISTW
jgi:hypothetical protein